MDAVARQFEVGCVACLRGVLQLCVCVEPLSEHLGVPLWVWDPESGMPVVCATGGPACIPPRLVPPRPPQRLNHRIEVPRSVPSMVTDRLLVMNFLVCIACVCVLPVFVCVLPVVCGLCVCVCVCANSAPLCPTLPHAPPSPPPPPPVPGRRAHHPPGAPHAKVRACRG